MRDDFFDMLTIEWNRFCAIVNALVIQEAIDDQQCITIPTVPFFKITISFQIFFLNSCCIVVVFVVVVSKCCISSIFLGGGGGEYRYILSSLTFYFSPIRYASGPDPDLIDYGWMLTAAGKREKRKHRFCMFQ